LQDYQKILFGNKSEVVAGGWEKVLSVELHNLYSSSNNIKGNKLRKLSWVGLAMFMGDEKFVHNFG
jgi:hypothetical protein